MLVIVVLLYDAGCCCCCCCCCLAGCGGEGDGEGHTAPDARKVKASAFVMWPAWDSDRERRVWAIAAVGASAAYPWDL